MTDTTLNLDSAAFTNYAADVKLPAFRFTRGGRHVYTITPTLEMAMDLLPKPDPAKKFPNNRLLNVPHARAWGTYWEKNEKSWGCPPGLISTPVSLSPRFATTTTLNGMAVGVLSLPRDFAQESEILDMQHRVFGWHEKRREVSEKILKLSNMIADAKAKGENEAVTALTPQLKALQHTKERLARECITIEIAEMSDAQHRDLFSNIASKALAINATQIVNFDESQALNRIARAVQSHPLLDGRVDWDKRSATDTKRVPNHNLVSGSNLADLVRPFALGHPVGRVMEGRNKALESQEQSITTQVSNFLTALMTAFPELAMSDEDGSPLVSAPEVRATSLLGSSTVLRALATAYYRLTRVKDERDRPLTPEMTHDEVVSYFEELAPFMKLPITKKSPWLKTGVFPDPGDGEVKAPGARSQEIKQLADLVTGWALGEDLGKGPLG
ncbi:DNA sulfur modification protein DndB [Nocardioides halotolerans]|uniref:DNA sulfur modification protein DndB n=1 Tax=Nocardioides halotolerans TaxID=433660 RepID=UPI000426F22E|nr:DNA sulfur modification protein DndB [Nocardioides halotolerans]